MKSILEMGYTKIIRQNIHANTPRCIYSRQQSGLKILSCMHSWTRVIAIDESWLDATDYRRRSWNYKHLPNSLPEPLVRPRISLLAAIDTGGEIYVSVCQSNTDYSVMEIFLRRLDEMLSEEDHNWKKTTLLIWDGAGYHHAAETLEVAKRL